MQQLFPPILALTFALAPCTALAAATVQVTGRLGLALEDFHYEEENDQGEIIDRESAHLPRLSLAVRAASARWFLSSSADYTKGDAEYLAYSSSQEGELRSTTSEEMVKLAVNFGALQQFSNTTRLEYFGTFGVRSWHRDIHSLPTLSGLDESYWWPYLGFGFKPVVQLNPSQSLTLSLVAGYVFAATLEVEFKDNLYDSVKLNLDDGILLEVEASWSYAVDKSLTLQVGPYLELWRFDRSNAATLERDGSPVGILFEPANLTRSVGARLFIIKNF